MRSVLSKMTAQDQNEATSRSSSTSLTMVSDCRNSSKIDRVGDTVPGSAVVSRGCIDGGLLWRHLDDWWRDRGLIRRAERGAQPRRDPAGTSVAPDAGEQQVECGEQRPAAVDLLVEQQRGGADLEDPGIDAQQIIEP